MATITETWTHADTASGISADQGWTTVSGTPKITGNRATAATGASWMATLDPLMATDHYTIECDLATGTTFGAGQARILFRYVNATNFYEFTGEAGGFFITRTVNGIAARLFTIVKPGGAAAAAGQRMRVVVKGTQFSCAVQLAGATTFTTVGTANDSSFPTGKKLGLAVNGSTSTIFFDNFSATDQPKFILVSVPTPSAYEKTASGTPKSGVVRLTASEAPGSNVSIPLTFAGGTAQGGVDYVTIPSSVTLPSGQTTVNINVTPIVRTGVFVGFDRIVRVSPGPAGGYIIDPVLSGDVTIRTLEYDQFGGVVGAAPTLVKRFVNGDGKHIYSDPATGPTGYYRVGMVGNRACIVSPEGNAMFGRGSWNVSAFDGSSNFQSAAATRFGVSNTAAAVGPPVVDFIIRSMSEVGWNYSGGNSSTYAQPIPATGQGTSTLIGVQRPGSIHRKPYCPYNSHQLRSQVGFAGNTRTKNLCANWTSGSRKGAPGSIALPDAFDDPDVMPGAPGAYKNACDYTLSNFIVDPVRFSNLDTHINGPEFAVRTTPWWFWFDFTERDFCTGMANYHLNAGYAIAACPPTMTSAPAVHTQTGPWNYNEPTVWSKQRWKQYLQTKYGTIGALNTAWGTGGFYTTFDSAGGYGVGTGILDENGQHSWFGTDAVRLADCQANLRDDLDEIERLYWHQLIGKLYAQARLVYPRHLAYIHTAGTQDASWIYSQVCAQYCDIVGGDKDFPQRHFYTSLTSGFVALTLSATSGSAVTVTATSASWNRHHRGCLIRNKNGVGYGIIQKVPSNTTVIVEVLQPFASTSLAANTWELRPMADSLWLKFGTPTISWTTVISNDSYFTLWSNGSGSPTLGNAIYNGNPNGGGGGGSPTTFYGFQPNGCDTQQRRADMHKLVEDARYGYTTADGSCPHVGTQWWAALDKWSEGTAFGIISIDCKKYNGATGERSQDGDFYTPVKAMNLARDASLFNEAIVIAPPPPNITGTYHTGDTVVAGTGLPSATVTVFIDNVSAGTATVQGDSTWTRTVTALTAGQVLTAKQNNGTDSTISASTTVLATTIAAPTITGSYVERDTVVNGTGVSGAIVTVRVNDGTQVLDAGQVTVTGGVWTCTLPFQLVQNMVITATQSLGGVDSSASAPVTVTAPAPDRVRIQAVKFIPGVRIEAVLRATVPPAEMARYADPNKHGLHPTPLPAEALEAIRTGRILERRAVLSAKGVFTWVAAQPLLQAKWQIFQDSITASDTSGADGVEGINSTWDGVSWS